MLYLPAKRSRSLLWWDDPIWETFWQPFKGPIIPCGSLVECYPISAKDQSRIHQFGKKVLPGLFLALYAGRIWKGDKLVADIEELETMDASEIYSKRLIAKEVIFPQENGNFIFPVADGRIKLPGGDQDLRTSTLMRHRLIRGESHVDFLGESEGSLPPPHDSFPHAGETINDFRSMSGNFLFRHYVEPRVKLYSPREESFPFCIQNFAYEFGRQARETHPRLLEYRWVTTGLTQPTLLEEKPPDGHVWSGERLTRKQLTSKPDHLWTELWEKMGRNAKLKERQKWSHEKPKLDNARKITRNLFHWPWGHTVQGNHPKSKKKIGNTNGSRCALQDMQEKYERRNPWQDWWFQFQICVYLGSQWIHKNA